MPLVVHLIPRTACRSVLFFLFLPLPYLDSGQFCQSWCLYCTTVAASISLQPWHVSFPLLSLSLSLYFPTSSPRRTGEDGGGGGSPDLPLFLSHPFSRLYSISSPFSSHNLFCPHRPTPSRDAFLSVSELLRRSQRCCPPPPSRRIRRSQTCTGETLKRATPPWAAKVPTMHKWSEKRREVRAKWH